MKISTVESEAGKKCKTTTRTEVCSVRIDKTLFGIPICHVLEIVGGVKPEPVPLAPPFVGGLVHYRGDVLTAVSLRQVLGFPAREGSEDILVVDNAGVSFGLLVDSVGEVLVASSDDYEPNPAIVCERKRILFSGAYKLKDELIVMLSPEQLDPIQLARAA